MLEILFLIWFVRKLAAIAEDKHRSKAWAGLGVVGWIGGEILGFTVGIEGGGMQVGGRAWALALVFAAAGAALAYLIVRRLEDHNDEREVFPEARIVER